MDALNTTILHRLFRVTKVLRTINESLTCATSALNRLDDPTLILYICKNTMRCKNLLRAHCVLQVGLMRLKPGYMPILE